MLTLDLKTQKLPAGLCLDSKFCFGQCVLHNNIRQNHVEADHCFCMHLAWSWDLVSKHANVDDPDRGHAHVVDNDRNDDC